MSQCVGGSLTDCDEFTTVPPKDLLGFEEVLSERRALENPSRHGRVKQVLQKKGKWSGLFAFFKVVDDERTPVRIKSAVDVSGLVLVFEGGSFTWPGVEIGFRRNVTLEPSGEAAEELHLELMTRSLKPLVIEVSSFLDGPECRHIIDKASPHVAQSDVSHMEHSKGKPVSTWRSSSTYFMPSDDEIVRKLDRRVSALTLTRVSQQEHAQVLRYNVGERYLAHHDAFCPREYAHHQEIMGLTKKGLFNRLATVFFYLTTVEGGGHTNFPMAGGLPFPMNTADCSRGVSIAPQEGRIIIFYTLDPAGSRDEYSLHTGCGVSNGTKWSVNKWIWNKKMSYLTDE